MQTQRRRILHRTLYVLAALLALNAARMTITMARDQSAVPSGVSIVPYTVTLIETVLAADGRKIADIPQTHAVRSDGARMIKTGEGDKGSRNVLLPNGIEAEVSDFLQAKSTTQKPVRASWLLDPRENCAKTMTGEAPFGQLVSVESVAGYRAAKLVAGSHTRWFALDHGCAVLKRIYDWGESGKSEQVLVSLIPGEPSPALFALPSHYREGPPSAFADEPSGTCDAKCRETRTAHFQRADTTYYRNRPRLQ